MATLVVVLVMTPAVMMVILEAMLATAAVRMVKREETVAKRAVMLVLTVVEMGQTQHVHPLRYDGDSS